MGFKEEDAKIRQFLTSKPGHLKSGVKKVAKLIGTNDLEAVRRIKKEMYKVSKYGVTPIRINPIAEVTPEMAAEILRKFSENNNQTILPESNSFFKPRRPRDRKEFNTDGIHLLMGCSHVPFHNVELHAGIRELIGALGDKMVGFHLMGDFADINSLSSHDRGKFTAVRGLTLGMEYEECNKELDLFEDILPETVVDKSYIYGNHEDRVGRYNGDMQNAKNPAILPVDALDLRRRGYAVHTKWSQDFCTVGDLDIFHGIYYNIHNAKKHLDTFNRNCAYVHTHRVQSYREGDLAAYNIGSCIDMGSVAFNYASRAMKQSWANGFALATVKDGKTYVQMIEVHNNKFMYDGQLY